MSYIELLDAKYAGIFTQFLLSSAKLNPTVSSLFLPWKILAEFQYFCFNVAISTAFSTANCYLLALLPTVVDFITILLPVGITAVEIVLITNSKMEAMCFFSWTRYRNLVVYMVVLTAFHIPCVLLAFWFDFILNSSLLYEHCSRVKNVRRILIILLKAIHVVKCVILAARTTLHLRPVKLILLNAKEVMVTDYH